MRARLAGMTLLSLLVALPLLAAPEGWADFYDKGLTAAERGEWAVARDLMQKAIAAKPVEQRSATHRNKTYVYVPHFWLGIALYQQGDIDGSLREFATSESQGVIQNTQYLAQLNSWKSRAQEERVKRAQQAASDVRKLADTAIHNATFCQADAMISGGYRSDDFQKGKRLLEEAVRKYDKAGTDQASYKKVAEDADRAKLLFESASMAAKSAQQRPVSRAPVTPPPTTPAKPAAATLAEEQRQKELKELRAAVSAKLDELDERLNGAEESFRNDRAIQSYVQNVRSQSEQWTAMLAAAEEPAGIQKIAQSVSMADAQLSEKLAMARAATVQPEQVEMPTTTSAEGREEIRRELRKAWGAYAAGGFAECESITTALIGIKRGTDEAYAIRGIARYAAAMTASDDALLDKAASDFATALKLNPRIRFDKKRLSPKLVTFFDEIRKSRTR